MAISKKAVLRKCFDALLLRTSHSMPAPDVSTCVAFNKFGPPSHVNSRPSTVVQSLHVRANVVQEFLGEHSCRLRISKCFSDAVGADVARASLPYWWAGEPMNWVVSWYPHP